MTDPMDDLHQASADLSPAAFAVWDAAWDCPIGDCSIKQGRRRQIAAALRAAADQVVPAPLVTPGGSKIWPSEPELSIRESLLAIAAEIEAQPDD